MMNAHDSSYARIITITLVGILVIIAAIWILRLIPRETANTDPRKDFVCLDNSCTVRKKCDGTALVIYTNVMNSAEPTKQRVPSSIECRG